MDARHALQELVEYFEGKRNSAIAAGATYASNKDKLSIEADCYDDAMRMARQYLNDCKQGAFL